MSTLRTDSIANRAGTGPVDLVKQSAAKAWANLNGTGTIALRDSFNVSSVVDNETGDYSFTWTNAMANGNYSAGGLSNNNTEDGANATFGPTRDFPPLASSFRWRNAAAGNSWSTTPRDALHVLLDTHGDLA